VPALCTIASMASCSSPGLVLRSYRSGCGFLVGEPKTVVAAGPTVFIRTTPKRQRGNSSIRRYLGGTPPSPLLSTPPSPMSNLREACNRRPHDKGYPASASSCVPPAAMKRSTSLRAIIRFLPK